MVCLISELRLLETDRPERVTHLRPHSTLPAASGAEPQGPRSVRGRACPQQDGEEPGSRHEGDTGAPGAGLGAPQLRAPAARSRPLSVRNVWRRLRALPSAPADTVRGNAAPPPPGPQPPLCPVCLSDSEPLQGGHAGGPSCDRLAPQHRVLGLTALEQEAGRPPAAGPSAVACRPPCRPPRPDSGRVGAWPPAPPAAPRTVQARSAAGGDPRRWRSPPDKGHPSPRGPQSGP